MLPPISVPTSQRKPLEGLARLSDTDFNALLIIAGDVAPTTSTYEMWERLVPHAKASSDQATMLMVATSLRRVLDDHRSTSEEVASAVALDTREKKWLAEEPEIDRLRSRLRQLLDVRSIALTAKASDLTSQNKNGYASARILTDVRPLFFGEPSAMQTNVAIIQHTLKIEVRLDDDLFTTMTPKELRDLQEVIGRALHKEEVLRAHLKDKQ
jgi:hypothetical protein